MYKLDACVVKSFKHDGYLHRQWRENWILPNECLLEEHREAGMFVVVNEKTPILEANGSEWVSKISAVSFFIPHYWFNVVALLEPTGIRYYCNVASPPYLYDNTLTYIDYDLDVILTVDGKYIIIDEDEYEAHKSRYKYSDILISKIEQGLADLVDRIEYEKAPFNASHVNYYYSKWKELNGE